MSTESILPIIELTDVRLSELRAIWLAAKDEAAVEKAYADINALLDVRIGLMKQRDGAL